MTARRSSARRRAASVAAALCLPCFAFLAAGAQFNPYRPQVRWNAYSWDDSPVYAPPGRYDATGAACRTQASAATSGASLSASLGPCTISGLVTGQYWDGAYTQQSSGSFDSGSFGTWAEATATPGSEIHGQVSSQGTAGANTRGGGELRVGYARFVSVAGPADVFRAVLSVTMVSGSGPFINGGSGEAQGLIWVAPATPGAYMDIGNAVDIEHVDGMGWDMRSFSVTMPWSQVTDNLFGFFLEGYVYADISSGSAPTEAWGGAGVDLSEPTITLYDAAGNDVTASHVIAYDALATTTPEPALVTLLGSGLAGLLGLAAVARRRAA